MDPFKVICPVVLSFTKSEHDIKSEGTDTLRREEDIDMVNTNDVIPMPSRLLDIGANENCIPHQILYYQHFHWLRY